MALDPLGVGPAPFDPSDPFGDMAGGVVDPNAIQPIQAPQTTFMADGGGGEPTGGVNINFPGPASSTQVKQRSGATRQAEDSANATQRRLDAYRAQVAQATGEIATDAQEAARVARGQEIAANQGAERGYGEAEKEYQRKIGEVTATQKATHEQALKDMQDHGKSPFADKSLVFKLGLALLSGSNSYNNYVMGLDPSRSPFANRIREITDRAEATQLAKMKSSQEYAKLQAEQGLKAADTWLQNRRGTIRDQLAAAVSAAQAAVQNAPASAEAGAQVQMPVLDPNGRPVLDAKGQPATEFVPFAVAKERVVAMEKERLAQNAQLDHLAGYDPVRHIVDAQAGAKPAPLASREDVEAVSTLEQAALDREAIADQIEANPHTWNGIKKMQEVQQIEEGLGKTGILKPAEFLSKLWTGQNLGHKMTKLGDSEGASIARGLEKVITQTAKGYGGSMTEADAARGATELGIQSQSAAEMAATLRRQAQQMRERSTSVRAQRTFNKPPPKDHGLEELRRTRVKVESGQHPKVGTDKARISKALEVIDGEIARLGGS